MPPASPHISTVIPPGPAVQARRMLTSLDGSGDGGRRRNLFSNSNSAVVPRKLRRLTVQKVPQRQRRLSLPPKDLRVEFGENRVMKEEKGSRALRERSRDSPASSSVKMEYCEEDDEDDDIRYELVESGDKNISSSDVEEDSEEDTYNGYMNLSSDGPSGLESPSESLRKRTEPYWVMEDDVDERSRKGKYYFVHNDGRPAERYRTDVLFRVRGGEEEEESGEEGEPSTSSAGCAFSSPGSGFIRLNDRWREEWSYGVQVLLNPRELPKFIVQPSDIPHTGRHEKFKMPDKYIFSSSAVPSYAEDKRVSIRLPPSRLYEGDRLDELFLDRLNSKKLLNNLPAVSLSTVLDLMNTFEIDCYQNIHSALLTSLHSPSQRHSEDVDEDAPCEICTFRDSGAEDEMIFCDGCNVCVHLSCYGLESVPKGDWACKMCEIIGFGAVDKLSCVLCPNKGGAMKPCDDGRRWAHVACALWIPEIRFIDVEKREPIADLDKVIEDRWRLKCSVCDLRQGACIQCSHGSCHSAFHVTCAQRSGFYMDYCEVENAIEFHSLCKKHTKLRTQVLSGEGTSGDEVEKSDEEEDDRNETVRSLEKHFWLHVQHEKVASSLKIDCLVASDVYEYWKLKRADNGCRSLIRNPENEIVVDEKAPILVLPSSPTSQPMLMANPKVEAILTTPFQRKAFRFQMFYQSADRGRNAIHMMLKRERQKKEIIDASRAVFQRIYEHDSAPVPLSQRTLAWMVDLVEQDMTPEEVAETDRLAAEQESRLEIVRYRQERGFSAAPVLHGELCLSALLSPPSPPSPPSFRPLPSGSTRLRQLYLSRPLEAPLFAAKENRTSGFPKRLPVNPTIASLRKPDLTVAVIPSRSTSSPSDVICFSTPRRRSQPMKSQNVMSGSASAPSTRSSQAKHSLRERRSDLKYF